MTTAPERLVNYGTMEFPAEPDNVAFARTAAAVFASRLDFTLDELDEIKVAVSEAVSNAVLHAYPGGGGVIRMELGVTGGGALKLTVIDDGVGIADVDAARRPQWTTRPDERMGLGLTVMQEYMDKLDVVSRPGAGTRVVMVKAPARAAVAGAR